MDCLRGCLVELQNWQRKVSAGNVAMFANLSAVLDENEEESLLDPLLKTEITHHLRSLESELNMYFPEFKEKEGIHSLGLLILLPFPLMLLISDRILLPKISMKKNTLMYSGIWCISHPKVSEIALRLLLLFSTIYLCESGFSTLLQIKNQRQNQLDVDPDMRQPRICRVTEKKHYHSSRWCVIKHAEVNCTFSKPNSTLLLSTSLL